MFSRIPASVIINTCPAAFAFAEQYDKIKSYLTFFRFGGGVRQLSGQDAQYLYVETEHAHLHLTSVVICDRSTVKGGLSASDIQRYVESRLHLWPLYYQKLVHVPLNLDHPYWMDDPAFDAGSHIEHVTLPRPGNWTQFRDVVEEIHSKPLDLTRPPWDMCIVDGLDSIDDIPKGAFAIVSRYHHAAIDGTSGAAILNALYDVAPHAETPEVTQPWQPESPPSWLNLANRAAVNSVRVPLRFARVLANALPGIGRNLLKSALGGDKSRDEVPDTRFNARVSPDRAFDAATFSLPELAAIRHAVPGATVNDVILTICGGALREYLDAIDELPDESLVAIAPINTRTASETDAEGNIIAIVFVPLHTEIDDPLMRLGAIREATIEAKESSGAISPRQMTDFAQSVPAPTGALAGWLMTTLGLGYRGPRFANCTVSNVPGPQQPLYLHGAEVLRILGIGPVVDGLGLMFTAMSYNGTISLTISGCKEITPDSDVLADCLRSAFASLKRAAEHAS